MMSPSYILQSNIGKTIDTSQGRHTDRLITVCYLPVTLVMLLVMIHYNHHTNLKVRVLMGMAGFVCAMIAVPLVRQL